MCSVSRYDPHLASFTMHSMNSPPLPAGARLIALSGNRDSRGRLDAFDRDTLPFTPARTFVISEVPPGATRAGHPLRCDEFLWVPVGSCRLTISDANRTSSVLLDSPDHGVFVPEGLMMELDNFAPRTLLVVLASKPYSEAEQFGAPRGGL
jgi:WxcM-like protein